MQNEGKTRKWIVWSVFIICVLIPLFVVLIELFGAKSIRSSRASPLLTSMRSAATGLEAYWIDYKVYPPGKPYSGDLPFSLTTPLAFLTNIPSDPFNLTPEEIDEWHKRRLRAPWFASLITTCFTLFAFLFLGACVGMKIGRLITTAVCVLPVYFLLISLILKFTAKGEALHESLGAFLALWTVILLAVPLLHVSFRSRSYHYTLLLGLMLVMSLASWVLYTEAFWQPSPISHQSFTYATNGHDRWILMSYGPNRELDTPVGEILNRGFLLHRENETFFNWIFPYTYDPTNGTVSPGDIWRVRHAVRKPDWGIYREL